MYRDFWRKGLSECHVAGLSEGLSEGNYRDHRIIRGNCRKGLSEGRLAEGIFIYHITVSYLKYIISLYHIFIYHRGRLAGRSHGGRLAEGINNNNNNNNNSSNNNDNNHNNTS